MHIFVSDDANKTRRPATEPQDIATCFAARSDNAERSPFGRTRRSASLLIMFKQNRLFEQFSIVAFAHVWSKTRAKVYIHQLNIACNSEGQQCANGAPKNLFRLHLRWDAH